MPRPDTKRTTTKTPRSATASGPPIAIPARPTDGDRPRRQQTRELAEAFRRHPKHVDRLVVHEVLDDRRHRGLLERGRGGDAFLCVHDRHAHVRERPCAVESVAGERAHRQVTGSRRRLIEDRLSTVRDGCILGTVTGRASRRVRWCDDGHLEVESRKALEQGVHPRAGRGDARIVRPDIGRMIGPQASITCPATLHVVTILRRSARLRRTPAAHADPTPRVLSVSRRQRAAR